MSTTFDTSSIPLDFNDYLTSPVGSKTPSHEQPQPNFLSATAGDSNHTASSANGTTNGSGSSESAYNDVFAPDPDEFDRALEQEDLSALNNLDFASLSALSDPVVPPAFLDYRSHPGPASTLTVSSESQSGYNDYNDNASYYSASHDSSYVPHHVALSAYGLTAAPQSATQQGSALFGHHPSANVPLQRQLQPSANAQYRAGPRSVRSDLDIDLADFSLGGAATPSSHPSGAGPAAASLYSSGNPAAAPALSHHLLFQQQQFANGIPGGTTNLNGAAQSIDPSTFESVQLLLSQAGNPAQAHHALASAVAAATSNAQAAAAAVAASQGHGLSLHQQQLHYGTQSHHRSLSFGNMGINAASAGGGPGSAATPASTVASNFSSLLQQPLHAQHQQQLNNLAIPPLDTNSVSNDMYYHASQQQRRHQQGGNGSEYNGGGSTYSAAGVKREATSSPAVSAQQDLHAPKRAAVPASGRSTHGGSTYSDNGEGGNRERKYQCPQCDRAFARAYNLKTHVATHDPHRVKSFVCKHAGCGRSFSRKHDLGRHYASIHNAPPPSSASAYSASGSTYSARGPNGKVEGGEDDEEDVLEEEDGVDGGLTTSAESASRETSEEVQQKAVGTGSKKRIHRERVYCEGCGNSWPKGGKETCECDDEHDT